MVPEGGRMQAVFPHLKNCSLLSFRVKLPPGRVLVCPVPQPTFSLSIIPCDHPLRPVIRQRERARESSCWECDCMPSLRRVAMLAQ